MCTIDDKVMMGGEESVRERVWSMRGEGVVHEWVGGGYGS